VRVVQPGHRFTPRELSLDVRLAGGVRKELVFAVVDEAGARQRGGSTIDDAIRWLSVGRLTP